MLFPGSAGTTKVISLDASYMIIFTINMLHFFYCCLTTVTVLCVKNYSNNIFGHISTVNVIISKQ